MRTAVANRSGAVRNVWSERFSGRRSGGVRRFFERSHHGDGPSGGIGFSYDTGGYCDSTGCPDDFWDFPIAYCPVYFAGEWYRGPFYYRYWQGDYYYWIRG